MPLKSTKNVSPMRSRSETLQKSITRNSPAGGGRFPGVSRASRTPARGSEKARGTSAIYGLNVLGCFGSYDRESRCLKTLQGCLFPMEGGSSIELCRTWPKAGMMRNGKLYQLETPERRTSVKGFGLWPTPRVSSGNGAGKHGRGGLDLPTAAALWPTPTVNGNHNRKRAGGKAGNGLATEVNLWPTPTAFDWNNVPKSRMGGGKYHGNLKEAVLLWPTPRTNGMCGGTGNWEQLKAKCAGMDEARKMGAGNGGQLNADWVERLMGYPDGWTDVDRDGVDRANRYPASWLDDSWDTIPRLAVKQNNRRKRIKGLGNAVVPQVAVYIWALAAMSV